MIGVYSTAGGTEGVFLPFSLLCFLLFLTAPVAAAEPSFFTDVAAQTGLDFVHHNGMSGELYFHEMMGGGGALFDADGDGDLDVYLVQGHPLGPEGGPGPAFSDRLYRNDLDEDGRLRFTDVTAPSGIGSRGYGMGVAAGDVDNDGDVDLYVTHFGDNVLWRNDGPGPTGEVTFTDVTAASGAGDRAWSVSAAFVDFDRDGWLDLYVANYVGFSLARHKPCRSHTGARDYCSPLAYGSEPDTLLRNRGDGTFERVSARAGIHAAYGAGLGVTAADFDGDGWLDLYVANDQSPNQMWLSRRGPGGAVTFADEALLAGTAVNADGRPEAGMGVGAGDVDGDGDPDLLVSHLTGETHTLYLNQGGGFFEDRTVAAGLGAASWEATGFGLAWIDVDNDGRLDAFVANGAVKHLEPLVRRGDPFPLHQRNQLFRNLGPGAGGAPRFEDASAGDALALSEVSRGVAAGDVDNDGDADLLVVNNNGPVRLLRNDVGQTSPWLGLRLLTRGRDALGARVGVVLSGGTTLWRQVGTDGSYASSNDPRVLFGLGGEGERPAVEKVLVRWPDGGTSEHAVDGIRRYHTLRQPEER